MSLQVLSLTGGYQFGSWGVHASLGAIVSGTLRDTGALMTEHDVLPGLSAALGVSKSWSFGERYFATGSFDLSASWAKTKSAAASEVSFSASDARIGATVGMQLPAKISPYLLARGFGGPVNWQRGSTDIVGTDRYHYQLGAGVSAQIGDSLSLFADLAAVGEQALSLGASYSL